jgi:hypothetical protein
MDEHVSHRICKEMSRYGRPRYETYLGVGKYLLEGHSTFSRFSGPAPSDVIELGLSPDCIAMVDFEGGPDLHVTSYYYPGLPGKRTRGRFKIIELEMPQELQKENWLAVVIHTKEQR